MNPIELGRLPYSSPVVQRFLCILVLSIGGVTLLGLRLKEADPDEQKQGLLVIGVICLGVVLWTVHALRRYPLRIFLGEEISVRTFFGTSVFMKSEVRQISFGLAEDPRSGYFAPIHKPKQASVVVNVQLNSGRTFTCQIEEEEVDHVEAYLRTDSALDGNTIEQLNTPRAFMKQFVECITEGALVNSHALFAMPAGDHFEHHTQQAPAYAVELKNLIDEHWFIDFEEISDSPDADSPYSLAQTPGEPLDAESLAVMRNVVLEKEPESGIWRFGRQTVNFIRQRREQA